ncbi:MAG: NAD(P)H-dependent glycerol-3-phosphate dehydrogenase [Clostridiales Family XIII bacterium]|nr:NAD(P)H-dependent glycerol-3-phosphate dehydrogenase [Clostridiales Family XIII bacterium]
MNIGLIGAGSWGTALANLLAGNGHSVRIWDLNAELLSELDADRENKRYLPGVKLEDAIDVVGQSAEALAGADIALFAVPAQHFRSALVGAREAIPAGALLVNVAKGIEQGTLMTISRIADEVAPDVPYAVISGPSHAEEVGRKMPTTVAVASRYLDKAELVQDVFMNEYFRVYTNSDVIGLELGGSLKNIIALGAGITDGMGYGDNTKAALMTRGIAEMTRLGVKMGAWAETFSGLSGIGDLIVTCTSMHSRNRRCGIMIGEGVPPQEASERVGMVVEGMFTAVAAYDLSKKLGVEMPITESIYRVVQGEVEPRAALTQLMQREKKHEREPVR